MTVAIPAGTLKNHASSSGPPRFGVREEPRRSRMESAPKSAADMLRLMEGCGTHIRHWPGGLSTSCIAASPTAGPSAHRNTCPQTTDGRAAAGRNHSPGRITAGLTTCLEFSHLRRSIVIPSRTRRTRSKRQTAPPMRVVLRLHPHPPFLPLPLSPCPPL
jgi:hypothetical protein